MALITTIRERFGKWLFGLIAIAMILFILFSDSFGITSWFGPDPTTIGKVNGERLEFTEFNEALSNQQKQAESSSSYEVVNQVWEQFVGSTVMKQELSKLGIIVGKKEIDELMTGDEANISPFIRQIFGNRQTGAFNVEEVRNYIQQAETSGTKEQKEQIKLIREEVAYQKQVEKFTTMVQQGVYTPSWLAQKTNAINGTNLSMAVVKVPFTSIPDDQVKVSDDEINTYIKANKGLFDEDPTANVEYLVFDVKTSKGDTMTVFNEMTKIVSDFTSSTNDSSTVMGLGGQMSPFFSSASSSNLADSIFNGALGKVYGPYMERNEMKVVKVSKRMIIDSTYVSHILISTQNDTTAAGIEAARVQAENIKTQVASGQLAFKAAATQYSADPSVRENQGQFKADQNMLNGFVPEFKEYAMNAPTGQLGIVKTKFGFHIITVDLRKKTPGTQFAQISRAIEPLKASMDAAKSQAVAFIGKNRTVEALRKSAAAQGMKVEKATLKEHDFSLQGVGKQEGARDLVKWANGDEASKGQVASMPFVIRDNQANFDSKYVVAALVSKKGKGLPTAADASEEIIAKVKNEKKGETIKSKMQGGDLNAIAAANAVKVDSVNISYNSRYGSPVMGNEVKVIGAGLKLENGQTSAPIVGSTGVYVVNLINKITPSDGDVEQAKKMATQRLKGGVQGRMLDALKKAANIKDYRGNFY